MSELKVIGKAGFLRVVPRFFRSSAEVAATSAEDAALLGSIPGREFRPAGVESLNIGGLSASDMKVLQQSHGAIEGVLTRIPGGIPRTTSDIKAVLQHINPLGGTDNCIECSLAVDDALAGRAATAGASATGKFLPQRFGGMSMTIYDRTPADIEQEITQAGEGARGVVAMQTPDGGKHMGNVANLGGKAYWIDGQLPGRMQASGIYDYYFYDQLKQGFTGHSLIRTDGEDL